MGATHTHPPMTQTLGIVLDPDAMARELPQTERETDAEFGRLLEEERQAIADHQLALTQNSCSARPTLRTCPTIALSVPMSSGLVQRSSMPRYTHTKWVRKRQTSPMRQAIPKKKELTTTQNHTRKSPSLFARRVSTKYRP